MEDKNSVKEEIRIKGFRTVFYFEHGKEFYHPPEQHDFWEMVYVDKGEIVAVTDGIGSALSAGEVIFHEPNEIHTHISNRKVSNNMFVVTFMTDSPAMEFFRKKTFKLDENLKTLLSLFLKEAKNAMGQVQRDYKLRRPADFSGAMFGSTQLMAGYIEEFLIKLIRSGNSAGNIIKASEESRRIGKKSTAELIKEYLQMQVYSSLSLDELCAHFFMGKSKLSSIFKEYTGKSPMQYFSALKVEEAKMLLRDGTDSVSEIADKLKFSGIHSFTRAFKIATGFSPTSYRKSIY